MGARQNLTAPDLQAIGRHVAALVAREGITQVALARTLKTDTKSLRSYLRGERPFPEKFRGTLAQLLSTPKDVLFAPPVRERLFEFLKGHAELAGRMADLATKAKTKLRALRTFGPPMKHFVEYRAVLANRLSQSDISIEIVEKIWFNDRLAELLGLHIRFPKQVSILQWAEQVGEARLTYGAPDLLIFDDTDALVLPYTDDHLGRSEILGFHIRGDAVRDIIDGRWEALRRAAIQFDVAYAEKTAFLNMKVHHERGRQAQWKKIRQAARAIANKDYMPMI